MGGKPLMLNGRWVCLDCHDPLCQPIYDGKKRRTALRCNTCRPLHWLRMDWLSGRLMAAAMLLRAIQRKQLARPDQFTCSDCDKQAFCYDHRDYGRPLDVDPVCRSCNTRRGSAKPINQLIVSALLLAHFGQAA